MPVQAVSVDELTGGGPIVVFTPTIADACLGCGALLAACFAHRGAFLITTLDATAPAWMTGEPAVHRVRSGRVRVTHGNENVRRARRDGTGNAVGPGGDHLDPVAPLEALGGGASAIRALSRSTNDEATGRRGAGRTVENIAELCRALGVRSLLLPLTRHRTSQHAGAVQMAASRVQEMNGAVRRWRYPLGGSSTVKGWTAGPDHRVRTLDTTPWRSAKREALARMDAAGFDLSAVAGPTAAGRDRADRLAGSPERYLRLATA